MSGEPNTGEESTDEAESRGWADLAVGLLAAVTYLVASQSLGTVESVVAAAAVGIAVAVALNYTSFR
ncbi:hypothetical protein [Haloarchaeobius sp. TZWSO28]|uniref:hypothetical protein n=1 Tax=unclassified Haloarchaeobius TaxID=2614452 RepID=UPI003EBF4307